MDLKFSFLLAMAAVSAAQNPNMLVSTGWLADRLNDPGIVVLHVGSQQDYDAGHIPGARLIGLSDISITGERGLRLELPPVDALEQAFGKLGISGRLRVIVYAGTDSMQSATRVWFTLDYVGLADRASLLDGGLALWKTEGRAISTEPVKPEPATFSAHPRTGTVVDAAWIGAREKTVSLIDARTPEFYTGASAGSMPRAGHIPGARNVPFTSFFDSHRKLKQPDALRELLNATGTVVTYCHIGQQATVPYFVARYLGLEAKLYDGSFQDWSMRTDLPVDTEP